jgi:hypothetical protein
MANTARIARKLAAIGITDIPVDSAIKPSYRTAWYDNSHCPSTNRVQMSVWTDGVTSTCEEWTDQPQGFFAGGTAGTKTVENATYVLYEVASRTLNGSTRRNATLSVSETLTKSQERAIVQAVANYRFGPIATTPGFLSALAGSDASDANRWMLKNLKIDSMSIPRDGERLIVTFVGGESWNRVYFYNCNNSDEWRCSDPGIRAMIKKFGINFPKIIWAWKFRK